MTDRASRSQFLHLMSTLARGWNSGDAKGAARCFTEDAIYTEPPGRHTYSGRQAIFKFFGGYEKPDPPMRMIWHHLAFDEPSQIGFGEYTFQGNHRYHGIAVVRLHGRRIANWRAYQYRSVKTWRAYFEANSF